MITINPSRKDRENVTCFDLSLSLDDLFADYMPTFLFDFFEKYLASVTRIHSQELNSVKVALNEARAGEESLRKTLSENYE